MRRLSLIAFESLPEIEAGADLAGEILRAASREGYAWRSGSILVVAQKAVSKTEGRSVALRTIEPSPRAIAFAREHGRDARLVELALREARTVLRMERGILITETRHGWVCANSGVDRSNVPGEDHALLLPEDPDRSAAELRGRLEEATGRRLAVVIADSFGRAWRIGQTEQAIGVAGVAPLIDRRGTADRQGRALTATIQAVADEIAAAAGLLMTKRSGTPVAVIEGLEAHAEDRPARELQRPKADDLFR